MKSSSHRRLALAAGLLLVALLVVAIGAQVAFAINDVGTGAGGGTTVSALPAPSAGVAAVPATQPAQASTTTSNGQAGIASALAAAPSSTQSTSSGSTTWIAIVISIVALVVGVVAWVSINNRRRPAESSLAAFCVQHPEDSLCRAA